MIRLSVIYPNIEGRKFDIEYYCNKHIPMCQEKLGAACTRIDVDQGLMDAKPGSKPSFVAMAHLTFDSMGTFQSSFGPHAKAFKADAANYTDIEPIIQFSEVKA